jgi:peptidoglycan hydrolase CwlO-like protein
MMILEKIAIIEPSNGFTERDASSKAILNTDVDSLLKYKIQKRKLSDINKSREEINEIHAEVDQIRNDIREIKNLLLTITGK